MSSFGSTTAATPASSSPIRYEAQPRSSCVSWRKSTGLPRTLPDGLAADAGSAVAGRVRREAGVLDLDHVAPAVRPGAVQIGEAVLAGQPSGRERAAVAAGDVGVGGQGGD